MHTNNRSLEAKSKWNKAIYTQMHTLTNNTQRNLASVPVIVPKGKKAIAASRWNSTADGQHRINLDDGP